VMGKVTDSQASYLLWVCVGCWREWREWKTTIENKAVSRFAPIGDQDNKALLLMEHMSNQINWKIAPNVVVRNLK